MPGYELLADFFTHMIFRQAYAAFPAFPLFSRAGQFRAIKIKVRAGNVVGEQPGAVEQDVPGGPEFPILKAVLGEQSVQVLDEGGHHVDEFQLWHAAGQEDAAYRLRQVGEVSGVEGFQAVAGVHHVPVSCGYVFF